MAQGPAATPYLTLARPLLDPHLSLRSPPAPPHTHRPIPISLSSPPSRCLPHRKREEQSLALLPPLDLSLHSLPRARRPPSQPCPSMACCSLQRPSPLLCFAPSSAPSAMALRHPLSRPRRQPAVGRHSAPSVSACSSRLHPSSLPLVLISEQQTRAPVALCARASCPVLLRQPPAAPVLELVRLLKPPP